MSSPPFNQCLNCGHLGHCAETDVDKVIEGYSCVNWKEVSREVFNARLRIINLAGKQGVKAIIQKDFKDED